MSAHNGRSNDLPARESCGRSCRCIQHLNFASPCRGYFSAPIFLTDHDNAQVQQRRRKPRTARMACFRNKDPSPTREEDFLNGKILIQWLRLIACA